MITWPVVPICTKQLRDVMRPLPNIIQAIFQAAVKAAA